jgi:two-component system NarL family response regulator
MRMSPVFFNPVATLLRVPVTQRLSAGPTALRRINMQTTEIIADNQVGDSEPLLKSYTVLIADEHPIVREGLATMINRRPDMRVVAEAANGREAVEKFVAHSPDVALLELRMPFMDGIQTVISIREKVPSARLVIFTTCLGEEDIYRALRAGAYGYLLKDTPLNELIECIRAVAQGERWIPVKVGASLGNRVAGRELTARESEVIRELSSGKSNKQIGTVLDISEATVKVHITHILEKLKVTGRGEAINIALRRGLVHMDPAAIM